MSNVQRQYVHSSEDRLLARQQEKHQQQKRATACSMLTHQAEFPELCIGYATSAQEQLFTH